MRNRVLSPLVFCALLAGLVPSGCTLGGRATGPGALRVFRLNAPDAPAVTTPDDHGCQIAISPDGMTAVHPGGVNRLMIRRLDEPAARLLVEHWGARDAFFSPDGRWVAYFAGQKLFRAPVAGGDQQTLIASLPGHAKGGCFTDDGILYSPESNAGLWLLPLDTLQPRSVTVPDRAAGELSHRWPAALPDGRGVLFTIKTSDLRDFNDAQVAVFDRSTGTKKVLVRGGTCARYLPTGYLAWASGGKLFAAPFDLATYTLHKDRTAVVCDDLRTQNESGAAMFAFAADGTLVYMVGSATERRRELVWVDRNNDIRPALGESRAFFGDLVRSHDGRFVAIPSAGANDSIWVYDIREADMRRFTADGNCGTPVWSEGSNELWFLSDRDGGCRLYAKALGGGVAREVLASVEFGSGFGPRLHRSRDGRWLAVARDGEIRVVDVQDTTKVRVLEATPGEDASSPVISPDGLHVAYLSESDGSNSIYLRTLDGAGPRLLAARIGGSAGASRVQWSADGSRLYYLSAGSIFEVPVEHSPALAVGRPVKILEVENGAGFCVDVEDENFLVCRLLPQRSTWEVRVMLNWFDCVATRCR